MHFLCLTMWDTSELRAFLLHCDLFVVMQFHSLCTCEWPMISPACIVRLQYWPLPDFCIPLYLSMFLSMSFFSCPLLFFQPFLFPFLYQPLDHFVFPFLPFQCFMYPMFLSSPSFPSFFRQPALRHMFFLYRPLLTGPL